MRAEILLTHGLGEHSGRYSHVAEAFARAGFRLWAYDLRGHGRSSGRQGDARSYGQLLGDLEAVESLVRTESHPFFYFGHSTGGQITIHRLLQPGAICQGAIIASPWLRLAFAPPLWRRLLARAAALLLPIFTQPTLTDPAKLSRDLAHMAALADPQLSHHHVSARLFLALQRGGAQALARAGELQAPLLVLHGAADQVTSYLASEEFYRRAGSRDKQFVGFPDLLHETHNDLGRERVLETITDWCKARLTTREVVRSTPPSSF